MSSSFLASSPLASSSSSSTFSPSRRPRGWRRPPCRTSPSPCRPRPRRGPSPGPSASRTSPGRRPWGSGTGSLVRLLLARVLVAVRAVEEVLERVADAERVERVLGLGGRRGRGGRLGGLVGGVGGLVVAGLLVGLRAGLLVGRGLLLRTGGGTARRGLRGGGVVLAGAVVLAVLLRGRRGRGGLGRLGRVRLVGPGDAGAGRERILDAVLGQGHLGRQPHAHEDRRRHGREGQRLLAARQVELGEQRLPGGRVAGPLALADLVAGVGVRPLSVVTPHGAPRLG